MYGKLFRSRLKSISLASVPNVFWRDDLLANILIFEHVQRVAVLDGVLYYYRAGGGSSKYYPELAHDIQEGYSWRKHYIQEHFGVNEERANLFNCLHDYKSFISGLRMDCSADVLSLKPLLDDRDRLNCHYEDLDNFYEMIESGGIVRFHRERIPISVMIKQIILKWL